MAFVKLMGPRGEEVKVPKGSVEMFKNLGFSPSEGYEEEIEEETVEEEQEYKEEIEEDAEEEKSEDEAFVEKISKKPLASWNKEEVKRYAAIFDIDLVGTKSANEAKERIKAYMSDAE